VGDAGEIVDNFTQYGDQLGRLVENVSELSVAAQNLPRLTGGTDQVRALHVSDIHLNPSVWPIIRSIIEEYDIDLVIDTGDIADQGTTVENRLFTPIETLGVPYVFIRGNHDSSATEQAIAGFDNVVVLDDEIAEVAGLTIAGIGDPRFTPDKSTERSDEEVVASGEELAATISIDPTLVHDPGAAPPLTDLAPLVLAGHLHTRDDIDLSELTQLLVLGSTGGAGLRALEAEDPTPLTLNVLYFDRVDGTLSARDEITLGGLGSATAEVERIVEDQPTDNERSEP
jgi:DNA repair exonuclease SbcCD nuclease subunit